MPRAPVSTVIGCFGKAPTQGDFVTRDLPASFVEPFDAWLRAGLAESRARLGAAWLDTYLTSPLWRLALAAGSCGSASAVGVMIPSVDRVGRYFPFVFVALLPGAPSPWRLLEGSRAWLAGAAELVLGVLADGFEPGRFAEAVRALGPPDMPAAPPDLTRGVAVAEPAKLCQVLAAIAPVGSLWSTDGGAGRLPAELVFRGLPPPEAFSALLDGRFAAAGFAEADA